MKKKNEKKCDELPTPLSATLGLIIISMMMIALGGRIGYQGFFPDPDQQSQLIQAQFDALDRSPPAPEEAEDDEVLP